ncbi:MAG: N-acetylglucosamine-6-phosphate deacetylase [Bryobacterales bacterium]
MSQTALIAKTIYTPDSISDGVVLFEDDRITAVGTREQVRVPSGAREVRVEKGFVAPGFIDTHNHGAGGRDVMQPDRDGLDTVCKVLARFGTTSYYPTTVTAPTESIRRAVEFLAEYIGETEKGPTGAAQPLGIHMEGPYISVKRRGVHPPPYIVEPTLEAYQQFAKAAGGRLRIMTIAPELAGAPEVIREMLSSGVQPSIGHTDSTFAEAEKAVEMGARQATHMFNAMRPFGHRDPGVIGKVLTDPRVKAELIADGIHVDVKAMELLYRCKGKDGIVLISDGISAVGMPDGNYQVGGLNVDVAGGVCRYEGALAGSVLTLDRAVRNMHTLVGVPLDEVIRMATLNTAQLMGLEGRKGSLTPGADADIVVMDDSFQIQQVYVRGIATN